MPIFTAAKADVLAIVAEATRMYHPRLNEAGVTVGVVMAEAKVDENGDPQGPALVVRGHAVLAKVRVVPAKERVQGLMDAEIVLDGDRWPLLSREERLAVLDHELAHLQLAAEVDDAGRPKLRLRHHDYEFGWFVEVAERHGAASQEVQQARAVFDEAGQALFPFAAPAPVKPEQQTMDLKRA